LGLLAGLLRGYYQWWGNRV